MIVKPTVNELLEHVENRFALVIATSKRARQIAQEQESSGNADEVSPVTIAANEIAESKVKICGEEIEEEQEEQEGKEEQEDKIENEE